MASWAVSSPPCARTISSRSNSIVTVRQHANWGYRFRVSVENSQKRNRSCGFRYKYHTKRLNWLGKRGGKGSGTGKRSYFNVQRSIVIEVRASRGHLPYKETKPREARTLNDN